MIITLIVILVLVVISAIAVRSYLNEDPSDMPVPPVDEPPEIPDDPDLPEHENPNLDDDIKEKMIPVQELDIPKRAKSALMDEQIRTVDGIRDVEDLTEISGIGPTYAEKIEEELKEV